MQDRHTGVLAEAPSEPEPELGRQMPSDDDVHVLHSSEPEKSESGDAGASNSSTRDVLLVDSGNTKQKRLRMKKGDTVRWFFRELGEHSVDSSLVFVPRVDPCLPQRRPPLQVRPLLRRKTDSGTFMTTEPGELVFLLDNTFSWLVDKRVQLDVQQVSGLGVTRVLEPTESTTTRPAPSQTTRMLNGDGKDDHHERLRRVTAQAAHTAVEIVDRVAARVAERQARLGLASPSTSCPRETDFLSHDDQHGGGSSSQNRAELNQCENESNDVSARLAALTAVPMRAWTQGRVLEWVGALELSPADAAAIKAAVAEEEINGDDLVDLKPKCVEISRYHPSRCVSGIAIFRSREYY